MSYEKWTVLYVLDPKVKPIRLLLGSNSLTTQVQPPGASNASKREFIPAKAEVEAGLGARVCINSRFCMVKMRLFNFLR